MKDDWRQYLKNYNKGLQIVMETEVMWCNPKRGTITQTTYWSDNTTTEREVYMYSPILLPLLFDLG